MLGEDQPRREEGPWGRNKTQQVAPAELLADCQHSKLAICGRKPYKKWTLQPHRSHSSWGCIEQKWGLPFEPCLRYRILSKYIAVLSHQITWWFVELHQITKQKLSKIPAAEASVTFFCPFGHACTTASLTGSVGVNRRCRRSKSLSHHPQGLYRLVQKSLLCGEG